MWATLLAMDESAQPLSDRQVVEAYCRAWLAGDVVTVLGFYHDDLVLTWPGDNHLAGQHIGQAASVDALLALQGLTNRVPVEVIDVFEGSQSIIAVVVERWSNSSDPNHTLDLTRALEFTVVDQKLRTCRIFETDQAAIDQWLGTERAS